MPEEEEGVNHIAEVLDPVKNDPANKKRKLLDASSTADPGPLLQVTLESPEHKKVKKEKN